MAQFFLASRLDHWPDYVLLSQTVMTGANPGQLLFLLVVCNFFTLNVSNSCPCLNVNTHGDSCMPSSAFQKPRSRMSTLAGFQPFARIHSRLISTSSVEYALVTLDYQAYLVWTSISLSHVPASKSAATATATAPESQILHTPVPQVSPNNNMPPSTETRAVFLQQV